MALAGTTEVMMKFRGDASGAISSMKGFNQKFGASMQTMRRAGTVAFAAVTGALTSMALSTAKLGDHFQKLSIQTGMSVESLSGLRFAAEQGGSSIESLEKGILRMTRGMMEAADGVATYKDTYDRLGVSVTNTDGTLRDAEDVLMDVSDAFAGMEDGTEKAALAQELFGRAGAELIPMLNEGSDGIHAMMEEAERLGIVFSQEAADASADFTDRLNELKLATSGIKNAIGLVVLEAVTPYIEKIKEVIVSVVQWIKDNKQLTEMIIKTVAVIGGAGGLLAVIGFIAPAIAGAVALISGPLGIVAGLIALGIIIAKLVNSYFPEFSSKLKEVVKNTAEWWGIIENVDRTLREHKENIQIAEHALKDMADGTRTADQAYKNLSDSMKDSMEPFNGSIDATKKLEDWLGKAKEQTDGLEQKTKGLDETLGGLATAVSTAAEEVEGLKENIEDTTEATGDFHEEIDDLFIRALPAGMQVAKVEYGEMGLFVASTYDGIEEKSEEATDKTVEDVKDSTDKMEKEWDKTLDAFTDTMTDWLGEGWGGFLGAMVDMFGTANPKGAMGDMRKAHDNFLETMGDSGTSWLSDPKGWAGFLGTFKGMFDGTLGGMLGSFGDWLAQLMTMFGPFLGWLGLLLNLPLPWGGGGDGGGTFEQPPDWPKGGKPMDQPPGIWGPPPGGTKPFQHGGIIPEAVLGFGRSGTRYLFGEAGPELVTPMNKAGGIGGITININGCYLPDRKSVDILTNAIQRRLTEKLADQGLVSFAGA